MEFSKKDKQAALNKILNSTTFKKTTTARVLLKLLFDSTLQNKELNAFTIGLELFGEQFEQDKLEVNTRVNVYHLRKKLQKYYDSEGKKDPVSISINPGQYKVSFSSKKEQKKSLLQSKLFFGTTVLILVIGGFYYYKINSSKTIWTPLFRNKHVTTLYMGEVFGYSGITPLSTLGWIRDFGINSPEDLYEEIRKDPEKLSHLKPANYSYVVFENAVALKPIIQYFFLNKNDLTIGKSNDFHMSQIREQNTIYTGPFFINSPFNELFNKFSNNVKVEVIDVSRKHYLIKHVNPKQDTDTVISFSANKEYEYTLAGGFRGPNNTMHYMFFSNHGMGLNAVVEYLTDKKPLHDLTKLLSSDSKEFVALFHVSGKDRTSMNLKLVLLDDNK